MVLWGTWSNVKHELSWISSMYYCITCYQSYRTVLQSYSEGLWRFWWGFQWPFQEPTLEVPTIYKAYFSGLCKGIFPQNMAQNMVLTYLHFRILKISHWAFPPKRKNLSLWSYDLPPGAARPGSPRATESQQVQAMNFKKPWPWIIRGWCHCPMFNGRSSGS